MMEYWISIIEGLLYMVGDEGLTVDQIASVTELDPLVVDEYLEHISNSCQTDSNRGIELVCYGGLYKFVTKASVHEYAAKLFALPERNKLSQAALETLAIIAYKQPITRVEIEDIRGVNCDAMLHKLLAKALIKEVGRSEAVGKPILYGVTDEFMDAFKLMSLDELPELPNLNNDEELNLFNEVAE
ncbi:MAG: SMC-Scp complex subunit ScpB [Erysipelotrichales bacterium]|nr:SMC-Scp complex subunit ScpB [Erysipelotrichales bacterium]